jgi:hypothetical protein
MPSKRKKIELICPCCGVTRGEQAKQALLDIELECKRHQVKGWWGSEGWSLQAAVGESLQWACPICLKRSVAIKGKPWLQTWCDYNPYFAFFDVELNCKDCKNKFIFSAFEQQFWYEKLSFWVQSRPKQCKNCRKIRRQIKHANIKLQELLKNYNRDDPIDIAKLAGLYFDINNHKKGSVFLRRAVNMAKKNQQEDELEAFLSENNLKLQD